jgi:putative endonuclease
VAAGIALDEWRLRRVVAAAEQLAPRFMRDGDDVRIDALFVLPRRWPRHLANVWQG